MSFHRKPSKLEQQPKMDFTRVLRLFLFFYLASCSLQNVTTRLKSRIHLRKKREMPSAAQIFRSRYSEKEDVVYSKMRKRKIDFPIGDRIFSLSTITGAVVEIFKKSPTSDNWMRIYENHGVYQARVSVHQVINKHRSETKLLDSRLVAVNESGWLSFHVTPAVQDWARDASTNRGLEVHIENAQPGKWAHRIAKLVRFVPQKKARGDENRPNLIIFFKQNYLKSR